MADRDEPVVQLELHGRDIAAETLADAGQHMIALLDEIGNELGLSGLTWRLGEPLFRCDGCGFTQPFDAPRAGWHNGDGNDYCPSCLIGGER